MGRVLVEVIICFPMISWYLVPQFLGDPYQTSAICSFGSEFLHYIHYSSAGGFIVGIIWTDVGLDCNLLRYFLHLFWAAFCCSVRMALCEHMALLQVAIFMSVVHHTYV